MTQEHDDAPQMPDLGPPTTRGVLRGIGSLVIWLIALLVWLFAFIALNGLSGRGYLLPAAMAMITLVVTWQISRLSWRRGVCLGAAITFGFAAVWYLSLRPSNDRDWWVETSIIPSIEINGDELTVRNVRNFSWTGVDTFEAHWEDRTYDLSELDALDLIVSPLNASGTVAHTMLSFGFGAERLLLSIEARKEVGEEYALLPGAFRQFEIAYLLMDERDGLGVRAVHRGAKIFAFPIKAEPDGIRTFLVDLLNTAEALQTTPRFYQAILDNCTTAWIRHADRRSKNPVGLRKETILTGLTGKLVYDRGAMDTDLSYDEALVAFQLDERIRERIADPAFSTVIREP